MRIVPMLTDDPRRESCTLAWSSRPFRPRSASRFGKTAFCRFAALALRLLLSKYPAFRFAALAAAPFRNNNHEHTNLNNHSHDNTTNNKYYHYDYYYCDSYYHYYMYVYIHTCIHKEMSSVSGAALSPGTPARLGPRRPRGAGRTFSAELNDVR